MRTKKELLLLLILMIVFTLFFFLGWINLNRGVALFGIGVSYELENYMIMILSILSMGRILWSIVKH